MNTALTFCFFWVKPKERKYLRKAPITEVIVNITFKTNYYHNCLKCTSPQNLVRIEKEIV